MTARRPWWRGSPPSTTCPFACIPTGTRNHFALDLGVDRDDVVGALDAFVDGTERRVDLAEVNGRVFVNNVSLGLYAEAVQREGYRDAKLRTILDTAPDVLGTGVRRCPRTSVWVDDTGQATDGAAVILVSNDVYRLGRAIGSGTRPRLDDGMLGVAVLSGVELGRGWRQWATPEFQVDAAGPVPAGVDGEALAARRAAALRLATRSAPRAHRTAAPGGVTVRDPAGLPARDPPAAGAHPGRRRPARRRQS